MNPTIRLYTPQGIAVGTLVGSLAAGAFMMWLNYRALGYTALANRVAGAGLVLYLLIILLASVLPEHPGLGLVFIALQTGFAYWTARTLQGSAIAYHRGQGGALHSTLAAAGVGLLAGLTVILLLLAVTAVLGVSPLDASQPE